MHGSIPQYQIPADETDWINYTRLLPGHLLKLSNSISFNDDAGGMHTDASAMLRGRH